MPKTQPYSRSLTLPVGVPLVPRTWIVYVTESPPIAATGPLTIRAELWA